MFILILLLLAAIFGVLGTVLKVTAVLFLSLILTITLLVALGWWAIKRQMREYATGQRGAPGQAAPRPPGGSGDVVDTQGRIKRDGLPE